MAALIDPEMVLAATQRNRHKLSYAESAFTHFFAKANGRLAGALELGGARRHDRVIEFVA